MHPIGPAVAVGIEFRFDPQLLANPPGRIRKRGDDLRLPIDEHGLGLLLGGSDGDTEH
jgi:hypothetical protein